MSRSSSGDTRAMRQFVTKQLYSFPRFETFQLIIRFTRICVAAFSNLRKLSTFRASRQEILNKRRPKVEYCMDKNSETTDTKPAGKKDAPQAFREIAEKGPTQANETCEKMNAATIERQRSYPHAKMKTAQNCSHQVDVTTRPQNAHIYSMCGSSCRTTFNNEL
jgi:hypothetical protein